MAKKDISLEENLELESENLSPEEFLTSEGNKENLESEDNPLTVDASNSAKASMDLVDYKDKYIRLLAEYTNFANQKDAELKSMAQFSNKNLLIKILDIVDDIEAGLVQESVSEETKSILEILKIKVLQILAMEGVLEIELSSGDSFDSEKCEVVQAIEDQKNSGKIVQVLRKGYTLSDRILRTAKVIVGK